MEWVAMVTGKKGRGRLISLLALLVPALAATSSLGAGQDNPLKVIVNPAAELSELHRDDLARIYLGKKTLWDTGTRIQPCLLNEKSPVTKQFLETDLRKTVRQYRAYWKRRLFSGGGIAPRTFRTSAQVLDFVVANEGAIGVVEATVDDDRIVVVTIKE
jgi:hypothetical protein